MRLLTDFLFLMLFFVFLVAWLFAYAIFHLTAGGVHLLVVLAVVFLLIHFMRGRSAV